MRRIFSHHWFFSSSENRSIRIENNVLSHTIEMLTKPNKTETQHLNQSNKHLNNNCIHSSTNITVTASPIGQNFLTFSTSRALEIDQTQFCFWFNVILYEKLKFLQQHIWLTIKIYLNLLNFSTLCWNITFMFVVKIRDPNHCLNEL